VTYTFNKKNISKHIDLINFIVYNIIIIENRYQLGEIYGGIYMFTSMLLSFREGLEAALVIGIILVYLFQSDRKDLSKFVYSGALLGLLVSIAGGFIGFMEARKLGEEGGEIFENLMRILAAGLIAYFIVWVGNQSKNISSDIKNKMGSSTSIIGIFILSFISVFREGIELSIMILTNISENTSDIAFGTGTGLILAVLVTYIIFRSSVKFNLKIIFKVLGFVLIILGTEMFSEGVLGLTELGEEPFEAIFAAIYLIPSLLIFFKNDMKRLSKQA